jgi:hypothetical protein
MTYDWDPYKEICYRMYVEERKSLREVHKFLKDTHNFEPRYVMSPIWAPVSTPPEVDMVVWSNHNPDYTVNRC